MAKELAVLQTSEVIDNVCIEEELVFEELCRTDPHKTSGPDNLPGRLLKEGAPWVVKPICDLMNASLQTGCLPRDWISANVFPVFKKGNKHIPTNYRPVSLTSLVVKVMERTRAFCIRVLLSFSLRIITCLKVNMGFGRVNPVILNC